MNNQYKLISLLQQISTDVNEMVAWMKVYANAAYDFVYM